MASTWVVDNIMVVAVMVMEYHSITCIRTVLVLGFMDRVPMHCMGVALSLALRNFNSRYNRLWI
jgi:hypothetical protein